MSLASCLAGLSCKPLLLTQPQPLEELTVEQPPDDVEIEPDEQTDAFTVSILRLVMNDALDRELSGSLLYSENSNMLKPCIMMSHQHGPLLLGFQNVYTDIILLQSSNNIFCVTVSLGF